MRTASLRSAPDAGFNEASSTPARLPGAILADVSHIRARELPRGLPQPWLVLREDDIRRPDGTPGIYGVIDKPTTRWSSPTTATGSALVEQFRYPLGARRWEFPQGTAPDLAHIAPHRAGAPRASGGDGPASGVVRLSWADSMSPRACAASRAGSSWPPASPRANPTASTRSRTCTARGSARADVERMIRDGITDAQSLAAFTLFVLTE